MFLAGCLTAGSFLFPQPTKDSSGTPRKVINQTRAVFLFIFCAGFIPSVLKNSLLDEIIQVSGEVAFSTARQLAAIEGIPGGISSGAAVWAALELAARPEIKGKRHPNLQPCVVVGVPGQVIRRKRLVDEHQTDLSHTKMPDAVMTNLQELMKRLAEVESRLEIHGDQLSQIQLQPDGV